MRVRLAGLAMAGLVGCAERAAIAPEPKIERVTLLPSLHTGEMLVYRVDAMIEGARGAEHASATLQFDDKVEVVSPAEIRETFANVAATGNGQLGDSLQRIATMLAVARKRGNLNRADRRA